MPNTNDFKEMLEKIFKIAKDLKLTGVVIKSGNLHQVVGGYPNPNHRMSMCVNAMRQMMKEGDEILCQPPCGKGASVEILYRL